jgi:hypothetical protein
MENLEEKQRLIRIVIDKVFTVVEAMIVSLSCSSCMEFVDDPYTCHPCGHTFCGEKC